MKGPMPGRLARWWWLALVRLVGLLSIIALGFSTFVLLLIADDSAALYFVCFIAVILGVVRIMVAVRGNVGLTLRSWDASWAGDELVVRLNWVAVLFEGLVLSLGTLALGWFAFRAQFWLHTLALGTCALGAALCWAHLISGAVRSCWSGFACKVNPRGIALAGLPFIPWERVLAASVSTARPGSTFHGWVELVHRQGGVFPRRRWWHWVAGPFYYLDSGDTVLRFGMRKWAVSPSVLSIALRTLGQRHAPEFAAWANAGAGQDVAMREVLRERERRASMEAAAREGQDDLAAVIKWGRQASPEEIEAALVDVDKAPDDWLRTIKGRLTAAPTARTP